MKQSTRRCWLLLAAVCLLGGGVGDCGLPVAAAHSSSDKPAAENALPAAVAEAVLDEAARHSERERSALQVVSAEQRQWPNGCLRLAEPDEVCTQAIVEGWRVTVASPERRWIYRTDQQGQRIRLERQAQASTASFSDIANDPYREETQTARKMGFIAGFDGNAFRPEQPLTREQAVSMLLEALGGIPQVAVALPSETKATPYSDIEASRWSAAKIAWAHQNGIVSGYGNETFRPTAQVTRAELIAIERRAAQYAQQQRGQGRELAAVRNAESFADTEGHWAQAAIRPWPGTAALQQRARIPSVPLSLSPIGRRAATTPPPQQSGCASAWRPSTRPFAWSAPRPTKQWQARSRLRAKRAGSGTLKGTFP
jgi:hypothetical protein